MVGIYSITSPSGRVYIGQSWDINARHRWYKSHFANEQPYLRNSFLKYGFDSHEMKVLHELPNDVGQEVLDRYEQLYIDAYRDCGFKMLNCKEGGLGGRHSKETKERISNKIKGRKYSDEHRKNISLAQTGRKNSPERIKNIIEAKRRNGFKVSDQARENCRNAQLGRKHSEESKNKRREKMIGIVHSDETKAKISAARKEWCKNNPEKVKIQMQKLNGNS